MHVSGGRRLISWTLAAITILVLLVALAGFAVSLWHPDLEAWHRKAPRSEPTAREIDAFQSLDEYAARETSVFSELEQIEWAASPGGPSLNRFDRESRSHRSRASRDWNRTFRQEPAHPRRGAVLVHGLSDGPYSMRAVAEALAAEGAYSVTPRLPGHGTVPAGLLTGSWEDSLAAVRLAIRDTRARIGPGTPLVLVGYSNGAALAVKYSLDALEAGETPPSRLVLISPMFGVAPALRAAQVLASLGKLPFMEKTAWLEVLPEYNPFKYNSFPAHAGAQTRALTSTVDEQVTRLARAGALAGFPPVLAFQSAADASVSGRALLEFLDRLPQNGSELVVFDVNRNADTNAFVAPEVEELLGRVSRPTAGGYRRIVVSNTPGAGSVTARVFGPGQPNDVAEALGLEWPDDMFSLSHVALPFPADDPLYGPDAPRAADGLVSLGRMPSRGERWMLDVPLETLVRAGWNPFFPFLRQRLVRFLADATD